jgi:nitroimidazol reductase NimA-like FMN-containing flavoprotein (pyridoxamine 5'-phosphate oxidase superfamily)
MTTHPQRPVAPQQEALPETEVGRYKWLQSHDINDLHSILDSGLVAHIGYVRDGYPLIIPMNYVRDGDTVLMHGSTGAGLNKAARSGVKLSMTVTLIDGLVYEYSLFNSTVNYRSAMAFGEAMPVTDNTEKERAVRMLSERLMPRRWDETPLPTRKELAATYILRLPLDRASVKIRKGGPSYEPVEGLWTGHVPITTELGQPVTQVGVAEPVSKSVDAARKLFAGQISVIPE